MVMVCSIYHTNIHISKHMCRSVWKYVPCLSLHLDVLALFCALYFPIIYIPIKKTCAGNL